MNSSDAVLIKEGKLLALMEAFYSIQGEGFHTGKAAYFLRIGGCDVGCHWCDVKESWDVNLHPLTEVDEIIRLIDETRVDTVVITGGEPLMWNLNLLCNRLRRKGLQVYLETSGAYPLSGEFDWICRHNRNRGRTRFAPDFHGHVCVSFRQGLILRFLKSSFANGLLLVTG